MSTLLLLAAASAGDFRTGSWGLGARAAEAGAMEVGVVNGHVGTYDGWTDSWDHLWLTGLRATVAATDRVALSLGALTSPTEGGGGVALGGRATLVDARHFWLAPTLRVGWTPLMGKTLDLGLALEADTAVGAFYASLPVVGLSVQDGEYDVFPPLLLGELGHLRDVGDRWQIGPSIESAALGATARYTSGRASVTAGAHATALFFLFTTASLQVDVPF